MKLVFVDKVYITESEDGRQLESKIENNKVSREVTVKICSWDNSKRHKFLKDLDGEKIKITIERFK